MIVHYALTASEALALGLQVKVDMQLMTLYPVQQSGGEHLPVDIPRQRRV